MKPREQKVLLAIEAVIKADSLAPTLSEIADYAGIDTATVCRSVQVLEREGWVSRKAGAYRSLQLARKVPAALKKIAA